jgi:hypothetical protein
MTGATYHKATSATWAAYREMYVVNIGWPTDLTYYKLLTDWGSLIGGGFALVAGAALYFIGRIQVNATRESADKEIAATREAISAAQEQTRVAQEQIAVTLRIERRRIARESFAFLATVEAVMAGVIEDVEAARRIFAQSSGSHSVPAFAARQQIRKTAFEDLRSTCLRIGGQLTAPFLHLDKEIDEFAAQWTYMPSAGDPIRMGVNAELLNQLDRIKLHAESLREEAGNGMRRCVAVLADTDGKDLP